MRQGQRYLVRLVNNDCVFRERFHNVEIFNSGCRRRRGKNMGRLQLQDSENQAMVDSFKDS